ncbi:MAG: LuxR C-terminal-related transcriptional regulator [Fermentimonas sp.]|jgi:DNA-binding CsgD family transcriptional regulator
MSVVLDRDSVVAEVLREHNELIPILNRFGIRLGVGRKSIGELCEERGLNELLVVGVLNVYLNLGNDVDDDFDELLRSIDIESVVDYLQMSADSYVNELVPNFEKHLNAFIAISGLESDELTAVRSVFAKFKEVLFECGSASDLIDTEGCLSLIGRLKSVLIEDLSGEYNQNMLHAVIFSVHSLEWDLKGYKVVIDKVLRPRLKGLNRGEMDSLRESLVMDGVYRMDSKDDMLTNREIEILRLIVSGNQNKEIADMLNISLNTVLTHRKNIMSKTGIKTVSGLTFYSIKNGIILI